MQLEKATQYHKNEYIGDDDEGVLCKGIVTFMIMGLKESMPYIVQVFPGVKFRGEWLADKMSNYIGDLTSAKLCVRGIVTDNRTLNVHTFSSLAAIFNSDAHQYIKHPGNFDKKTYLFYDTVHIMKNIRNNLLNRKKCVFSEFIYSNGLKLISIFQQVLFSGKICMISMTKKKDCQAI